MDLLQDALHRPVGLGADTLSKDSADLESGEGILNYSAHREDVRIE